ncbi:MAG TPA: hypothetical protein VFF08_01940 [Trueperaceae bacterium]|nr:hypothetical protein [Trueperaceae bacterium]
MNDALTYLEWSMRDRQRELLAEGRRLAQARSARSDVRLVHEGTPARDRTLLTTVGRPGVSLALRPRQPAAIVADCAEIVADCAERVAAWRRAAASVGRSLVNVGRRLEQVGRSA